MNISLTGKIPFGWYKGGFRGKARHILKQIAETAPLIGFLKCKQTICDQRSTSRFLFQALSSLMMTSFFCFGV